MYAGGGISAGKANVCVCVLRVGFSFGKGQCVHAEGGISLCASTC